MIEAMKLPCRTTMRASSQCYSPCRMHLLLILLLTSLVEPFRIDSSRYFPCTFRFNAARPRRTVLSQLSSTDQSKTEEELRKSLIASVTRPANGTGQNFDGTILTENYIDTDGDFFNVLKSRRPYYSIIVERMMQSIDDYQLSLKLKSSSLLQKQSISSKSVNSLVKEKIVVLGTGWGAHAFLKSIDATMYDVVVISPRNYFTFTPMLAASAVGTVEFRSICEPIRNVNPLANYLESAASSINFDEKVVSCVSVKCEGTACDMTTFDLSYDYLVLAVGATTNTFGIKGVREHCQFLKQIEDAIALRKAIANCFERANIPSLREEEIRAALSFVVVGAGPTGVEFTGELRDWLEVEGRRYYGGLLKYVRLTLVEAGSSVLAVFDESLQQEAIKKLSERETSLIADGYISEEITKIMLKSGVKEVGETYIEFMNGERLNYGFCVWAAGNGPIPLILDAVERVDAQKDIQSKARGRVAVDGWLRMVGTQGVFSIGDCSFISESPLPATAQVASQQGAYLGRLFSKGFRMKGGSTMLPPAKLSLQTEGTVSIGVTDAEGSKAEFASEKYNIGKLGLKKTNRKDVVEYAKPFQFLNLGVLAYVGASQAMAQISVDDKNIKSSGGVGFLLWRGIYWFKQVSWRNRALVSIDWAKARLFGRDIGSI